MKCYQIAIYIRLSKEDEGCKKESNSIAMQRMLLQRYAAEHFRDYTLLEFCDDGYTGTNFERPGMQAMLEMAKNSEIDCIMVKDFSRFARDYIELGSYLEQIFPFLGIRFISVNDNYDSRNAHAGFIDMDVNFKNLLYDLYSKDLSRKVRSSLRVKKEQGQYVSANSPFGYEKAPDDRHKLLIAEDEAAIVRRIFSLTLEGCTSVQIARLFNETGVKTPIEFKIEKGETSRTPRGAKFIWSSSTICAILRNEVYVGNIVQKKYARDFVGGKNRLRSREDWEITYHHHAPVIAQDIFDRVQLRHGGRKNSVKEKTSLPERQAVRRDGKRDLCYERYAVKPEEELKELKVRQRILLSRAEKLKMVKAEQYQNYALGRTKFFQPDEQAEKILEQELERLNCHIRKLEKECGAGR